MRLPANKDLDDLDVMILDLLQKESQISNVELSRRVSLSPPATHARLKRLEKEGYIDQYAVVLSKEKLGFDLLCFIFINTNMHQIEQLEQFEETVLKMPQILECFNLTGEYDYMLKAVLQSREDLHTFIRKLTLLTSISKIQTSIVMKEVKFSTTLPILDKGE